MASRRTLQQYSLDAKDAKRKGKKIVTEANSEEILSDDSSNSASPTKKKIKLGGSANPHVFPVHHATPQVHDSSSESKVDEVIDDVWEKAAKEQYAREKVDHDDGTWKPWPVNDTTLIFIEHTASILEQAAAKVEEPATTDADSVEEQDAANFGEPASDEEDTEQADEEIATEPVAAPVDATDPIADEQDVGQDAAAEHEDTVADSSFPSPTQS